eukprot:COSAG01_NODE_35343_length_533_cov_1.013825_2_plen_76_part_01
MLAPCNNTDEVVVWVHVQLRGVVVGLGAPCSSSIFLDKNRRDILYANLSQNVATQMTETGRSRRRRAGGAAEPATG